MRKDLVERKELFRHLEIFLPLGIIIVEFDRTNLDRIIKKKIVSTQEAANINEVFSRQQKCSRMFL